MHKRRFLRILLALVAIVVLIAGGLVSWVMVGSLPRYTGKARIAGLSAPVTVFHDAYGVPHIFAASMKDAARALGYAHASERLFQMEMQRRAGQGRLAEVVGPSTLNMDKFTRTLNLYPLAASSFDALSPYAQDIFDAYAQGVNAWIDTHHGRLPPEFALLGFTPEPWRPADSLVWSKLMALQLSHNYKLEMLRAQLATHLTPAQIQNLFPPYGDAPVTLEPKPSKRAALDKEPPRVTAAAMPLPALMNDDLYISDALDQLGHLTGLGHAASNEWVVAGSRTDTGKPILANDPHLELGAPILWYLARIVTPEGSVKGATVPGVPVVLLGQNDRAAWGLTTTGSDVEDLFIETVDPQNPDRYLSPTGSRVFDDHTEVIHVKGAQDVVLHIRATRHGPVLSDLDPKMAKLAGAGKVMALQFTGLGGQDTTAEALLRIDRATNWHDFINALQYYQSPPQNIVFADSKGDIGFANPGLVPMRKRGDGLAPVDGASGTYDWAAAIPFALMPQLLNPPAGYIFNANNAVAAPDPQRFLGTDWDESYRARRLQQFFDVESQQSLDSAAAMQADNLSLAAFALLPYLLEQRPLGGPSAQAFALLRKWNGQMDKAKAEPLIFEAWLYEMHQNLLIERAGQPLAAKGPYAASTIAWILAHPETGWCPNKNCTAIIQRSFDDAMNLLTRRDGSDMTKWRWGDEHRTVFTSKVFSHIPLLGHIADISVGSSGDFYTLNRGGGFVTDPDHPFSHDHGAGYRGIYDLADPARSRFMIATGQSGHILSKHYSDLVPLWNEGKYIELTGSADELRAQHLPELVLEPATPGDQSASRR